MTPQAILLSLIKSEVFGTELSEEIKKSLNSQLVPKLYNLAGAHEVMFMFCDAVGKTGAPLEEEISSRLLNKQMQAMFRHERLSYESEQSFKLLEENEIPFIPLKGTVIRTLYPEPWMRSSCDVDILVNKSDCERIIELFKSTLGYTERKSETLHDYKLVSPSGVLIELHYTLIENDRMPEAGKYLDRIWEYAEKSEGFSYRHELCGEMFMFYHVAHMAKHFINGGCGIRTFVDMSLIRQKMKFDASRLEEMLQNAGLLEFYRGSSELCEMWFENGESTELALGMERYIMNGGIFGTAHNSAAISAGKGESSAEAFMKIAFLPRKKLERIYPKLKDYPVLFPYYQVKRWLGVFDNKRRNKLKIMSNIRASVSKDGTDNAKMLIDRLKLG